MGSDSRQGKDTLLQNIQTVPGAWDAFSGVSQLNREAGHTPPSTYLSKNKWTYTSTPTYVLMEWSGTNLLLPFRAVGGTPVYGLLYYDVSRRNVYLHRRLKLIQGDQKVSVHLMITMLHYLAQSDCLAADRQGQGDTGLTLTPSVIPNSNYVIMVSDRNYLKYFCLCFVLYSTGTQRILIALYFCMWNIGV
jgi:hypothetical protein